MYGHGAGGLEIRNNYATIFLTPALAFNNEFYH